MDFKRDKSITFDGICNQLEDGVYEDLIPMPNYDSYEHFSRDHIFDENLCVKENRKMVEEYNKQMSKEWKEVSDKYYVEKDKQIDLLTNHLTNAVMNYLKIEDEELAGDCIIMSTRRYRSKETVRYTRNQCDYVKQFLDYGRNRKD